MEVALFWVTPEIFGPRAALRVVLPVAVPCRVIVPTWLMATVFSSMVFAASPRLLSNRLPVPVRPPAMIATALVVPDIALLKV